MAGNQYDNQNLKNMAKKEEFTPNGAVMVDGIEIKTYGYSTLPRPFPHRSMIKNLKLRSKTI